MKQGFPQVKLKRQVIRRAFRRRLVAQGWSSRIIRRGAAAPGGRVFLITAIRLGAEHRHVVSDNFRRVARDAFFFPRPGSQFPFDVHQISFVEVLCGYVRQPSPQSNIVPLCYFLSLTGGLVFVCLRCSHSEVRYGSSTFEVPHVRVFPQPSN